MADEVKADPDAVIDLTDGAQIVVDDTAAPLWRRVVAWILALLAIVAVVLAVQALWLKTTLQDENQFVSTFESLPQNDAVATALSVRVADGVIETQEVQVFVTGLLPDGISFLAAPITESIGRLLAEGANTVIQADVVTQAWSDALRGTHIAVSAVLTGNDRALEAENGQIAINLDEIAAVVVERVEARGVDLPDGSIELGTVVIYENEDLAAAQTVAQLIAAVGWFLPVVAIVFIALALLVTTNRRRMAAILGFGTAIALLASLVALRFTQNALLDDIEDPITREAAEAVWDITLARLTAGAWALLILALIVGFLAWLVGPSQRAQGMRSRGGATIDGWRRPAEDEPSEFVAFLIEWKRTIQVVIVVLGLLFVLFGPTPSGWLVLGTTVVVLALVVLVEVMAGPARSPAEQRVDAEV